ncbi:MAG: glycosyltransferase [Bacteroidales bacterium]|nr:glycosyltransferase [Bacteroidales bacterium]
MRLSIVIVNYNVKFFLEQCLNSVFEALQGIDSEVWVVDNNSVDGSVAMLKEKFPQVRLIANKENVGFSKANNQALRQINGDCVLLLNPDTLVESDTFAKCLAFMDEHPDCGGLGVKMINGEGEYLRESKRGFPTPKVAFYKISGLIKLFPHSPKYAHYYLGHLDPDQTAEIEILSGAFLMTRKEVLDKIGLLDENFFMYGEDIDFSYRIIKAGYKNYYLPTTRIIHYKGESTKKGSLNYVYTFYNSMAIFTQKHFKDSSARIFTLGIKMAIWARASLSFLKRLISNVLVPLLDFLFIYLGFFVIKNLWATFKAANINYYPPEYTYFIVPMYVLLWVLCVLLCGGYRKPVKLLKILKGLAFGTATLLIFYSLLDETQRYSRALILLGSVWAVVATLSLRGILHLLKIKGYSLSAEKHKAYLIVGDKAETQRVGNLLGTFGIMPSFVGGVSPEPTDDSYFVGDSTQIADLVRFYKIDEVVFCGKNLQPEQIITLMTSLQTCNLEYKIVPQESQFVIGSGDIYSAEDAYAIRIKSLALPRKRRQKRVFDFVSAFIVLLFSPVLWLFQRNKKGFFGKVFAVLFCKKTWVGYGKGFEQQSLPTIKPCLIPVCGIDEMKRIADCRHFNNMYVRNYRVSTDLAILFRNLFKI